jgi:hypothetical protein
MVEFTSSQKLNIFPQQNSRVETIDELPPPSIDRSPVI